MLNGTSSYKKRHLSAPNVISSSSSFFVTTLSYLVAFQVFPCCCFKKITVYWEKTKETRKLHFLGALSTECPTKGSECKYFYVELLGGPTSDTNTAWLWSLEVGVLMHEGGYHRVAG